jgi:hypothetical protein
MRGPGRSRSSGDGRERRYVRFLLKDYLAAIDVSSL